MFKVIVLSLLARSALARLEIIIELEHLSYTLNKNTLKTLIKLAKLKKNNP